MTERDALYDAFTELERKADLVSAARPASGEARHRSANSLAPRRRLMIAATVVGVAAVATAVALVVPSGSSDGHQAAAPPAAPASSSATISPSSTAPTSTPSTSKPPTPTLKSAPAGPAESTPGSKVPGTAKDMIRSFKRVLGDTATFTVTQSYGNYLIGVLTASGNKGGFDIQAAEGSPGDEAICEDADTSHCKVTRTSGGGSLSTGHESTGGSGTLYLVDYVRPDGASFLMHLSTETDPKGAGPSLGSKPPLSIKQMVAILESPRW